MLGLDVALGVAGIVLFCFSFILLFGAPFLPTLKPQVQTALDLLDLKPGQTLLDVGCGDGRVLIAAAKQGINGIGYELNPLLFIVAWAQTRRYRSHIRVIFGNYWQASWPNTDGIFGFVLPRYMHKLHKKITQFPHRPVRLVSVAFQIPDLTPDVSRGGVYLYLYP